MKNRDQSVELLQKYIENDNLRHHCHMVATAMEAYARKLDKFHEEVEAWWTAGLLHDLDWEKHPEEHPNKAVADILPQKGYPETIINAIEAHAPERRGRKRERKIEREGGGCEEL